MVTKDTGFEIFAESIQSEFGPFLEKMGFHGEQIDPRLFIFSDASLTLKVYLPECHGYDVTVTLSPTFTTTHYDNSERQLYWVGRFCNVGEFRTSRRSSPKQIPELVKLNADFLIRVLEVLDLSQPDMWEELNHFIHKRIEEERSKYKF